MTVSEAKRNKIKAVIRQKLVDGSRITYREIEKKYKTSYRTVQRFKGEVIIEMEQEIKKRSREKEEMTRKSRERKEMEFALRKRLEKQIREEVKKEYAGIMKISRWVIEYVINQEVRKKKGERPTKDYTPDEYIEKMKKCLESYESKKNMKTSGVGILSDYEMDAESRRKVNRVTSILKKQGFRPKK